MVANQNETVVYKSLCNYNNYKRINLKLKTKKKSGQYIRSQGKKEKKK